MGKISEKVGFVGGGAMAQVQTIILMHLSILYMTIFFNFSAY